MTTPASNFLGMEGRHADFATARYAVLPVPYEGTVSYKAGTAEGPREILDASQQVELFDEELMGEFFEAGIATLPAVPSADDPGEQMARVRAAAEPVMRAGKFLLTLGGEHSITAPLVEAAAAAMGPLSVLQIDAHADLRDTYGWTKHSHACVMRRVLATTGRICQVGIRNFSREEYEQCPQQVARFLTPEIVATNANWVDRALDLLDATVYVTVDIDGLDPSVAPGTGTPEPGGLSWRQVTTLLRRVCTRRRVIGADIVEVRPIPPNHVTEFAAARLAYKIIAYTQLSSR
jgi:agmatinase